MKTRHILLFTSLMMAATACGTQRQVGGEVPAMEKGHTVHADKDKEATGLRFMQRVADNALYQRTWCRTSPSPWSATETRSPYQAS